MKNQTAVVIETGQTLAEIGRGARRWVFPVRGRAQAGRGTKHNQDSERSI